MSTHLTKSRRGAFVLLGLALLIVQPVAFIAVRTAFGAHRFDGMSLISLLLVGAGAFILHRFSIRPGA